MGKRIDSLGRVTEPLALHLWEKSWERKRPHIEWNPKQLIVHASGKSRHESVSDSYAGGFELFERSVLLLRNRVLLRCELLYNPIADHIKEVAE